MLELHDLELRRVSIIAAVMIAVALGGLLFSRLRNTLPAKLCWWFPLALIPQVVLFLQLHISLPVWNLLPKLRYLQFPWRWLVVLEAPMAIFFASAVWPSQSARRWQRFTVATVCALVFLGASAAAGKLFFQVCDSEDNVLAMGEVYRAGTGFEGAGEYSPIGADNSMIAVGLPAACLVDAPTTELGQGAQEDVNPVWSPGQHSCEATFAAATNLPQHLRISAVAPHAGYLILRLRNYPAWQVKVNGQPVSDLPRRNDGLMAVPVPQGPVDLTVDWTTTPDVLAGRRLSALAVLLLTGLWFMERKLSQPRLS